MVNVGTGTHGTKYLKTKWPHQEGLTLGTTKISNRIASLKPQKSLIPEKEKVGINL